MQYDMQSRPGMTYPAAFFILLGLLGVGLIVGSLAGAGVWFAMTGKGIFSMEKEMTNPANVQAVRMLQLVSTFFIFFLPAYFTSLLMNRRPFKFMGFNPYFGWRELAFVVGIMLASLPMVGALAEINKAIPIPANWEKIFQELEDTFEQQVKVLSKITGFGDYLFSLVVMALAPAIFEEAFFRGGMQNILHRWTRNPWIAIGITSVIFSLIHFSYYGFIPRIALGIVLGLIYYYSGNLWLAIAGHFFNNGLIVTQIYVMTRMGKSVDDLNDDTAPIWIGLLALAVLAGLFYYFRIYSRQRRQAMMPAEDRALEEKWLA